MTTTRSMTITQRFWHYTVKSNGCWTWVGGIDKDGYGRLSGDGKNVRAHRFSFELAHGSINPDLPLDHLCRVRHCVNPDHLEMVTPKENLLRGVSKQALNARKTHCDRGHEFTAENTYRAPGDPSRRQCRACASRPRGDAGRGEKVSCPTCGVQVRRDTLGRHVKRRHR